MNNLAVRYPTPGTQQNIVHVEQHTTTAEQAASAVQVTAERDTSAVQATAEQATSAVQATAERDTCAVQEK